MNIDRCVRSVAWSDDIVVVDDGSTDNTTTLAEEAGARVVSHSFTSFADQRNWALRHGRLKHAWALHLDADEAGTAELEQALRRLFTGSLDSPYLAFRMCRKTMFMGRWLKYSDGFPVWIMRLTKVGDAWFQDRGHGEVAVPTVNGKIGTISEPFLHFPFSKGIEDWLTRHNRYSTREAELELVSQPTFSWRGLVRRDRAIRRQQLRDLARRAPFRPTLRFLYQYVVKLGVLDGYPGFVFSRLMGMYEWMIVLKKRELQLGRGIE